MGYVERMIDTAEIYKSQLPQYESQGWEVLGEVDGIVVVWREVDYGN